MAWHGELDLKIVHRPHGSFTRVRFPPIPSLVIFPTNITRWVPFARFGMDFSAGLVGRRSGLHGLVVLILYASTSTAVPLERAAAAGGELRLRVVDAQSGLPLVARLQLKNSRGRLPRVRGSGLVRFPSWYVIEHEATLKLRSDRYTFEVFAGPQYRHQYGNFVIEDHAEDEKTIELRRHADLSREGWYAADLDVDLEPRLAALAAESEDLNLVPLRRANKAAGTRSANRKATAVEARDGDASRLLAAIASPDSSAGGKLLGFQLPPVAGSAHAAPVHVEVAYPFAWQLPVWLANDQVDSFQLLCSNSRLEEVVDHEREGYPRNRLLFPPPHGNTRWAETIYYHILNTGIRLPPSAGSGAGKFNVPAGTNRVYAHCGEPLSFERWFAALKSGQVFVTNGPLLRVEVDGHSPGHVFDLERDESREFAIHLRLATRRPIEYLQIIKNGLVDQEIRLGGDTAGGSPPRVKFSASGWFLVRAITNNTDIYEFASTGPFYVEHGDGPRIDRESVQFFLDWIDKARRQTSLPEDVWEQAREFWQQRLGEAA